MGIDRPDEDDGLRGGSEHGAADSVPVTGPERDLDSEAQERASFSAQYRGRVDAVYREHRVSDKASDGWDAAVPALREAWAEHELKWSVTERSSVRSVSAEVAGSWHGDGGRRLSPDANAEVGRGCERIREVGENVITPAMRRIEAEDPERHLVGLEYRLKGEDRLKEKVADQLRSTPGLRPSQALSVIPDAVRFTFVYNEDSYSTSVRTDMGRLRDSGFVQVESRNTWTSEQYVGINSRWREPASGQLIEVQFHTQASFEAKQVTHGAYERLRNPETTDDERDELKAFQRRACANIPVPPGSVEIEDNQLEKLNG